VVIAFFTSICRVIIEFWPVRFSLALASSGFCNSLVQSQLELEAEVGIALRRRFVRILTTPVQINQLRSFPSENTVSCQSERFKNYPASSSSKFSHYSPSIILLELLVEVAAGFRRNFFG